MSQEIVVEAPVKSPWASTVNWTVLVSMLASMLVAWLGKIGLTVDSSQAATVVMLFIQGIAGLYIWIRHTWFEPKVISSSANQLMMVKK